MSTHDDLSHLIDSVEDLPWLDDAACGDMELDELSIFFVEAGRTLAPQTAALCKRCPVRRECLTHAYRHQIAGGYFGGLSPAKRRTLSLDEALATLD